MPSTQLVSDGTAVPGNWLCQFDVRVDLPNNLSTTALESVVASAIAAFTSGAGWTSNVQVYLIATSTGSVAQTTQVETLQQIETPQPASPI